jgi:hypothetical protein
VKPVIGHAQIKGGVVELQCGHVGLDELDRVLRPHSTRHFARPLEHVRRNVGRGVSHRLAGTQDAKGEAAPAGYVEYRGTGRDVCKSRDVGEHASHVGTPHRPGADHCNTVVLDSGVVHGGHDTLSAPPLRYIAHL